MESFLGIISTFLGILLVVRSQVLVLILLSGYLFLGILDIIKVLRNLVLYFFDFFGASWTMKKLKVVVEDPPLILLMVLCIQRIINTIWSILTFFLNLDLLLDFGFYSRLRYYSRFFRFFSVLETLELRLLILFPIDFWDFLDNVP